MHLDFAIIGAPKCGTTWLTKRLYAHPNIAIPVDELHFFSREWQRGWDWYEEQFSGCQGSVIGENSNSYLTEPEALPRIRQAMPDGRFIVILRNPVDRAYSSYGMQIDRGRADNRIDLYLDPERSPRPHILTNGLYAKLLQPWYEAFPAERIQLLLFDDIAAQPEKLYREVLKFVGADSDFVPHNMLERENARKSVGIPGNVKRALWWMRPYLNHGVLKSVRNGPIAGLATKLLSRPKSYPAMTPEIVQRLSSYYSEDIRRLEHMTGLNFGLWREKNERRTAQLLDSAKTARAA